MPASQPPSPPLSLRGAWEALRWPTAGDLLFSVKGVLAVTLALAIGFSANLENPYWSALTIYVLMSQPQAGAIRAKGLFRLAGTVLGGTGAIVLTGLFGSDVGALLISLFVFIIGALYLKLLDRTPGNYLWFATSLTAAVIGIVHIQAPEDIFGFALARMLEISLGVVCISLVDSVLSPRAQLPAFLEALTGWRDEAAKWAADAMAPDASNDPKARWARRKALRKISGRTAVLDAQGVQLPFDVGPAPPRPRDLRFLRLTVAWLLAQMSAMNLWVEAARDIHGEDAEAAALVAEARAWIARTPPLRERATVEHADEGEAIERRMRDRAVALIDGGDDPDRVLRGTVLYRLHQLLQEWGRQHRVLHALSTGGDLPPGLRREARVARPVRSIDYLASVLDIAPLALAFAGCTLVWYLSAWTGALGALLFAYVVCGFILGTPGALRSGVGELVWVCVSAALTFIYQFAVLPRVTAFPTLIGVLAVGALPLGVFMAMSTAGLLILANAFGFLGLQGVYAADFQSTLENLAASLTGGLIAVGVIHLCSYDAPRFRARRLARAVALDVAAVAGGRRAADMDRYVSLSVDRLSLFFAATASLKADDPLRRINMIRRYRVGASLLWLRRAEGGLSPGARAAAQALRSEAAAGYRGGGDPPDDTLSPAVERAWTAAAANAPGPARREALMALTALRINLRPDPAFDAEIGEAGL